MALNLEDKKAIVAEVAEVAGAALSAIAADYRGLTVGQMNTLRVRARQSGVYVRVVRNTLARRALVNTEFACMSDSLIGPMVLAFSKDEPGAAARLFRDFCKDNKKMSVKLLALNGQLHGPEQLETIAKLPSRDEAIALLMSVMKAPITKFVRTVREPHAKFVRTVAAVRDQKQSAS
ncbi:MAG: 50S ribosomal protein L10 [Gammaproteobacteria bacterium]|nr:50S ribosomal protein L10 [Gammaproteobacteria bacterium]